MSKNNKNKQKKSVKPQVVEEKKTPKAEAKKERKEVNISRIIDEYNQDFDALSTIHDEFTAKEKVLMGVRVDKITKGSTKSQIVDPTLQTAVLKQNNETMAQMPTGKVKAYLGDEGKSLLMNLLLENHILPNANTQFDIYTKFWLLSLYRKVYGSFGVLVDYVQSDQYTGADFTLIPARSLVPQKGRYTVNSCDYISVRSVVSKKWLLDRDTKYWKNIDKLITDAPEAKPDTDYQTFIEEKYSTDSTSGSSSKKDEFELITRYYKDRWITFSKDMKLILRDIDNPHKNGEIPIVIAHSYPLLHRFFGLGEFERGMVLHKAQSSLVNLYMDGVKMSIFPPLKLDPKNLVMETIKRDPGAMWFVKGGNMGAIDQMQISPQGLNTFQSTYAFLKGAMLTLTNTTDTSISSNTDPGLGKSQRYSEPVLTPTGWVTMGELQVGDKVIDDAGKSAEVLEIHEQGKIDSYDVYFSDGTKTNCSLDHLWTVTNKRNHAKKEDKTLAQMLETGLFRDAYDKRYEKTNKSYYYSVDLVAPVEMEAKELPIDPYLMGLLLGDGGFSEDRQTISFTNSKEDIKDAVRELLPVGDRLVSKGKRANEFRIYGKVVDSLEEYGLKGHLSKEKWIPEDYLFNSLENRQRLFQGLIDTDGYHATETCIEYCTTSEKLAQDFLELSRSLGYYTSMVVGVSSAVYRGELKKYGNKYRIYINAKKRKNIIAIQKSEPEESRCLFVDTPNHLYVTNGYTLTHNTPQALKMQQMTQQMRSGFDRKMMDIAIEGIYNKMIDVMLARQEKPIKLKFMQGEVEQIKKRYPDVQELLKGDKGELVIKPTDITDTKYRFNIDTGSTVQKDQALENETLTSLLELIFKIPGAPEQIQATGTITVGNQTINFAEIMKQWVITSGIHDWDKIIEDAKEMGIEEGMMPNQQEMMPPMPQGMPPMDPTMGQGMPQGMPMQQPQASQYQPTGNQEVDQIMQEIINGNRIA